MNNTTSKQAEKLAEIGAQFKKIREDKELSIPHLTATTLISERYLRAIENGEMESLPEPVYVRGFIRKYGDALGLGDLSEEFPLNPILPEQKWAGSAAAELRPLHLYALYVGVIAGAVSLLATFLSPPDANKVNDSQTNFGKAAEIVSGKAFNPNPELTPKSGGLSILRQPQAEVPVVSANPVPAPPQPNLIPTSPTTSTAIPASQLPTSSPTSLASAGSQFSNMIGNWANVSGLSQNTNPNISNDSFTFVGNKPINVGIVMKGQSWLRIVVDGQTEFEGVLDEGKKLTWSGDRQISVRAGNASSVALSYNNQPIKLLGSEGEVIEKLFGVNQASNNNNVSSELGMRSLIDLGSANRNP